jgi:hypothetical protein
VTAVTDCELLEIAVEELERHRAPCVAAAVDIEMPQTFLDRVRRFLSR